jgi:hypothetical protein
MGVMRKGTTGFLLFALLVALAVSGALAAEKPRKTAPDATTPQQGIESVTDGQGNPIPLGNYAAGPKSRGASPGSGDRPAEIRRGQAWWPYPDARPPYNSIDKRVELMTEDEIQVNGVLSFSARNPEAAMNRVPAGLRLVAGSQLARSEGFYLVKIAGFTRTQEQIDALTGAGAVLGEYMNVNTYIAMIPSGSLAAVRSLSFVTYIGDYHPAYKISPRIGLERIPQAVAIDSVTGQIL